MIKPKQNKNVFVQDLMEIKPMSTRVPAEYANP